MYISTRSNKAFTLVELMVVIALIMVIATIILASISQARQNTREKKRLSDLANIEFALTLYNEKNRDYPEYDSGAEIGVSGAIDSIITQYNGNVYADPMSTGSGGGSYAYWYDSNFTCYEAGQRVIFARTMEQSKNANFDEVCTSSSKDTAVAGSNTYIVVLRQ